jgi:monoamine oxidase
MGCVIKVIVSYAEAWWRAAGLSGQTVSDSGPLVATYDDCTPDGHFALVGFINGREALKWSPIGAAARRSAVLDQLVSLFNNRAALNAVAYHETDWTKEEHSRGEAVAIPL